MDTAAEGIRRGGARKGRGYIGQMVGMGFSKEVLRGSWLGKAVEESGPVGGSCKPKGPEVGTSWVCSRNRKEALTVGPFTSLHTAPRPPEA